MREPIHVAFDFVVSPLNGLRYSAWLAEAIEDERVRMLRPGGQHLVVRDYEKTPLIVTRYLNVCLEGSTRRDAPSVINLYKIRKNRWTNETFKEFAELSETMDFEPQGFWNGTLWATSDDLDLYWLKF